MKRQLLGILLAASSFQLFAAPDAPATLLTNLSSTTGCVASETNVCTMAFNDLFIFINYIKICDQLKNWQLSYTTPDNDKITFTADADHFCKATVELNSSTSPKIKYCYLSASDIQQMSGHDAMAGLQQLSTTGQISSQLMQTVFKPINDCIRKKEIAPRFLNPQPPAS